jgi:hypothetical protein
MTHAYKICPRCTQSAELAAPGCCACGHVYRTNRDATVLAAPSRHRLDFPHTSTGPYQGNLWYPLNSNNVNTVAVLVIKPSLVSRQRRE